MGVYKVRTANGKRYHYRTVPVLAPPSQAAPPPGALPTSFTAMPSMNMTMPLYGGSPTHYLVKTNGVWSDPTVWSTGTVPNASSDVQIQANANVTVTDQNAIAQNIVIQGSLHVCHGPGLVGPAHNSRLTAMTISVLDGGLFRVGDPNDPIEPSVTVEVVISDVTMNTLFDPEQYGHGIMVTGESDTSMPGMMMGPSGMFRTCGASRLPNMVRLASEVALNVTSLVLSQSVAGKWMVGDVLELADTRQMSTGTNTSGWWGTSTNPAQWELLTIAAISPDGLTLTLAAPTAYSHRGGRKFDGTWDTQPLYPYVANITRNVIFRSANPSGVRGTCIFTLRADIDIRHTEFRDMGRTLNAVLDNTTFDGSGNVTHVGTNQIGRYPIHFHHCWGPAAASATLTTLPEDNPRRNQGAVYGCVVRNPSQLIPRDGSVNTASNYAKWGIVFHNSSWLYGGYNVVTDYCGADMVEEDGTETENYVENNYLTRSWGTGLRDDFGRDGAGYWARSCYNRIKDNVACNIGPGTYCYGYTFFQYQLGGGLGTNQIQIPLVPGADMSMPPDNVNSKLINGNQRGFLECSNNEVYGAVSGLAYWWVATAEFGSDIGGHGGTIQNLTVWHYQHYGVFGYAAFQLTIDGLKVRDDRTGNVLGVHADYGFWCADYFQTDVTYTNCDVSGPVAAYPSPDRTKGTFTVSNSLFTTQNGIMLTTITTAAAGWGAAGDRIFVIDNVISNILPGYSHGNLNYTYIDITDGFGSNPFVPTTITVTKWMGVSTQNFRLYMAPHWVSGGGNDPQGNPSSRSAQDPAFIPAPTSGGFVGSPNSGKTNQYLHDNYGPWVSGANQSTYAPPKTPPNSTTPGWCVGGTLLPATASYTKYPDIYGFTEDI